MSAKQEPAVRSPLLDHVRRCARRDDPGSVIAAIDAYSRSAGDMIHLGEDKGPILDRAAADSGAHRILELGTNYGYSALRLMLNAGAGAVVHTVEIDDRLNRIARQIFAFAGVADRVVAHRGKAATIIDSFDDPFDLVFIDHFPQNYLPDLRQLEKRGLVQTGATVITDNVVVFESQLGPYLAHLRRGGGYDSVLHRPQSGFDGVEVSVRR